MPNDARLQLRSTPGARALLARILEAPDLPAQIERLPPAVLGKLIDRVGLADAGEIVALATTPQLAQMFDEDLWKNDRPGEQEQFDADRFVLWLDVMLEAGEDFVAKKLADLPEDLVTLALHRHVLVIDIDALAAEMEDGEEANSQLEKALESTPHEEIEEYRLIARRHDGWDTLLTAVLALDKEHHDHLRRILERCCAMSAQYIEENDGLYEVLTSEEMLEADVAGDREDRRAEKGHVAPTSAKSFLALARTEKKDATDTRDPVTKAYFRDLDRTPPAPAPKRGERDPLHTLPRILAEAGISEESAAPRLVSGAPGASEEPLLIQAMRALGEADPRLFEARTEELAYLANVLVAGCSFRDRRLRPIEGLRAAIATCSIGLIQSIPASERRPGGGAPVSAAAEVLRSLSSDSLFRKGFRRLHDDVVIPAARVAVQGLETASSHPDAPDPKRIAKAAAALRAALADGVPWTARSRLDVLPLTLATPSVEALRGLLDELPSFAGVLAQSAHSKAGEEAIRFLTTEADLTLAARFLQSLGGQPRTVEVSGPPPAEKEPVPAKKPVSRERAPAKKPASKKKAPAGKPVSKNKAPAKKPAGR